MSQKLVLDCLSASLEKVFDPEGCEEDFSDLQSAYGLLLSVSKLDRAEAPQQVRIGYSYFGIHCHSFTLCFMHSIKTNYSVCCCLDDSI